jgi:hypothetical protein
MTKKKKERLKPISFMDTGTKMWSAFMQVVATTEGSGKAKAKEKRVHSIENSFQTEINKIRYLNQIIPVII